MTPAFRLFLGALAACLVSNANAQDGQGSPDYVGSETCAPCHADQVQRWRGSHHDLAWTTPDEGVVLGDFDDATFVHDGVTSRFKRRGSGYVVETEDRDGAVRDFNVMGVAGIAPLQQYLVETEPGRVQALDTAWDIETERWYHLYPDQDLPHSDGLHWTGPYKNWNARCAECHATGYEKRYNPIERFYASRQAEIGVGCEACHGPGEAHLQWAEDPTSADLGAWRSVSETGLTIALGEASAETEIQQCAACHARREPFLDGNPLPGTSFHDAYRLALLRDGLYHDDGTIKDEVYVYGSFLQSKMYARGVRCSNCHEPHSATLKAEGDAVCTQCHSPAGNADFPTLKKKRYDDPAHHFHQAGTEGAQCVSCHMVERVYMQIDARRDHSFRIPRPDLSVALGTPNACTDCHAGQSASWAAERLRAWFPDSTARGPHFATIFHRARTEPDGAGVDNDLLSVALDNAQSGIVRATALDLLKRYSSRAIADRTVGLLSHDNPIIRAAAIPLQRAAPPQQWIERITTMLDAPKAAVRIEAARSFLDMIAQGAPDQAMAIARSAFAEYQGALRAKADFPETQMAIAGTALLLRRYDAADRAFSEAVAMDPQLLDGWSMLIRMKSARGDRRGAIETARRAVDANPEAPVLNQQLQELLSR